MKRQTQGSNKYLYPALYKHPVLCSVTLKDQVSHPCHTELLIWHSLPGTTDTYLNCGEILNFHGTPRYRTVTTKMSSLNSIQKQLNSLHVFTPYLSKLCLVMILPHKPMASFPAVFQRKFYITLFPHVF